MSKTAVIVTTSGDRSVVEFDDSTAYKTISGAVQGYVERVHFNDYVMWVNEEGKLKGLDFNVFADDLFSQQYVSTGDWIVGDVVFTGLDDEEGNTIGLTDEQVEFFINYRKEEL